MALLPLPLGFWTPGTVSCGHCAQILYERLAITPLRCKSEGFRVQSKLRSGSGLLTLRPVLLCLARPPRLSFFAALTLHRLVRPIALLRAPSWCFHHLLWNAAFNKQPEVTEGVLHGVSSISRKEQRRWWMQRQYHRLVCLVKHSNTSWIFKEIKN